MIPNCLGLLVPTSVPIGGFDPVGVEPFYNYLRYSTPLL